MNGRRHLLHPRRRRLIAWLDTVDVDTEPRVTTHLETCRRCAARLDDLALADLDPADPNSSGRGSVGGRVGDGPDALDRAVAAAISDEWSIPEELPVRIRRAITARERAEQEFELLLGLVSIGKDTAELLLPDTGPGRPEDRGDELVRSGDAVADDQESGPRTPEKEDPS